jgi:uncharacterized protein with ParB-like and HNH nuclease domain
MQRVGELSLKEIFDKDLYIPDFQRPYSWNNEQVEQLIEDLKEAYENKKLYLIGNMIIYENKEKNKLEIIDGQQRITTLALLLYILGEKTNFLENTINVLEKAKKLKEMIERKNPNCLIEVDGGVSDKNIKELKQAGVDVVVAGSYVFKNDYKTAIESLKV